MWLPSRVSLNKGVLISLHVFDSPCTSCYCQDLRSRESRQVSSILVQSNTYLSVWGTRVAGPRASQPAPVHLIQLRNEAWLACSSCNVASFCNSDCQKRASKSVMSGKGVLWKRHKEICGHVVKTRCLLPRSPRTCWCS